MNRHLAALFLVPLAASAQTSTTDCMVNGQWVSCQTTQQRSRQSSIPYTQRDPNAFERAARAEQEMRLRELEAQRQRELMRQQAENLRLQNEQLKQNSAPATSELISAEAALIRRAFLDLDDQQMKAPEGQRMTQDQFAAALGKRIRLDLGRNPRPESFEAAIEQVRAIKEDRERRAP